MGRDNAAYVGGRRRRSYFEGWYFKLVSPAGKSVSFIPGISTDQSGTPSAFVQVIADGQTQYVPFDATRFDADPRVLDVRVGDSAFSRRRVHISIPDVFGGIHGTVAFSDLSTLPVRPLQPGIMGWYRYVPFMECYHEVASVRHSLAGVLTIGAETVDFTGGTGYIEKDWGVSMPQSWLWAQCNTFPGSDASLMVSIARIPWLGRSFTGFLGFFADGGYVRQFGTYSGARVTALEALSNGAKGTIESTSFTISFDARHAGTGELQAPVAGSMDRAIKESVAASLTVAVEDRERGYTFGSTGGSGGLEVVGSLSQLAEQLHR